VVDADNLCRCVVSAHEPKIRLTGWVEVDGNRLHAGTTQQFFTLLALNAGSLVTHADIEFELVSLGDKEVHACVRDVRKATLLTIETFRGLGYSLKVDPCDVDVLCFLHVVTAIQANGLSESLREAQWARRRALSHIRGELSPGASIGPGLHKWTERIQRNVHGMQYGFYLTALQLGQHHDVLGELQTLWSDDPGRQDVAALLMLALFRCMQAARASMVFQRVQQIQCDEYGLDPAPQLVELQRLILAGDTSLLSHDVTPENILQR
jgi:hypothetical protein